MSGKWIVHKFGGSSLADAEAYRHVGRIVEGEHAERSAVVVSAMAGVTDALIGLVDLAGSRDPSYSSALRALRRRELELVGDLFPAESGRELVALIEQDLDDIEDVLRAIWLMRSHPPSALDLIAGYGELWSSRVLSAHLAASNEKVDWLDARQILTVSPGELSPIVSWKDSLGRMDDWLRESESRIVVIPGFVASDESGLPTTLGRNGSDYTASIFAALLRAEHVQIWTDVDGVLSADPRQVDEVVVLDRLSYDEAMELAYFGAKVVHPSTMAPVVEREIPITIRNTFRPEARGTRIHTGSSTEFPVKGFATIENMALFNLEGTGMIGVPGISERLFGALREARVSVVMISQGSSEHSICFALPSQQIGVAREAIERAFYAELHQGQIQTLEVTDDCAILAVVGDSMAGIPGVAAKFFGSLGKAAVNVRAIAQGSSERNISVVIDGKQARRAVRAVHSGFYLSNQTLSIGVVGAGLVGSTLLDQIAGQLSRLRDQQRIDLRVRGIATSKKMLLDERQIGLTDWRSRFEQDGADLDLRRLVDHVHTDAVPHAVIIDCTASDDIAARYGEWLERGVHVITPNKKANTADMAYYQRLRQGGRDMRMHYLYETTVGAGLPIIQTLRDLIQTGDEILGIEGVLSGTLSYLFNAFDGKRAFSEIVREAKQKGFTEPDPREDLSGMDVARKVVILAREMGLPLELAEVEVESLVPEELQSSSVDEFLDRLVELDAKLNALLADARSKGEVLRFVGSVQPSGRSTVQLRRYAASHPFARIELTDNIVQFRTRRYRDNPLVVQGPGAGTDVTAGGAFADLLRLAAYLGGS